jgi:hypothetical protein
LSKQQAQKSNFLALAKYAPMHGLMTSLRATMSLETALSDDFYSELAKVLATTVNCMLQLLSGGSKTKNASFAEMGIAVENLLDQDSADVAGEDQVNISDEHSLILACAWLNLKECCLVSSKVFATSEIGVIETCGQVILSVLTGTRHKGALEAASAALADLSCQLLNRPQFSKIPEKWLHMTLQESLENVQENTSVTRRSAGLPLLVKAIVASEPSGSSGGRHLLNLAILKLVDIIQKSNKSDVMISTVDETEDVPQCHALHVLK